MSVTHTYKHRNFHHTHKQKQKHTYKHMNFHHTHRETDTETHMQLNNKYANKKCTNKRTHTHTNASQSQTHMHPQPFLPQLLLRGSSKEICDLTGKVFHTESLLYIKTNTHVIWEKGHHFVGYLLYSYHVLLKSFLRFKLRPILCFCNYMYKHFEWTIAAKTDKHLKWKKKIFFSCNFEMISKQNWTKNKSCKRAWLLFISQDDFFHLNIFQSPWNTFWTIVKLIILPLLKQKHKILII